MRCTTIITSLAAVLAMAGAAGAATLNVGPGQTYTTIQAAITTAASGDTIQVAAGTYPETGQIVIDKNLIILGAGASTTFVTPDIDYPAGWWSVGAGKSLILQGVTLDCAGRTVPTCILNNGSGAIQQCVFSNVRGADYVGIALDSFGNMNVAGCTFQNIERVGVRTTDSTCTISGNTYSGKGDSVPCLDYFLEIRRGCNVTIQNNTITNCTGLAYDGSGSCAIQAYSDWPTFAQTTVSFSGNTVSDCSMGIVIGTYASDDNTIAVLRNNNLAGLQPALESGSIVQVDAENNWWGQSTGPTAEQIVTSGTSWGSPWNGSVDSTPWLTEPPIIKPASDNVIYLVPTAGSIYVKPTETVIVDMNVANLTTPVLGLQAMLKFSSTYFLSGSGDVNVAAGGGVWDELIYDMWNEGGDLDVAVGVHLGLTAGTQADATTAIITLKAKADGVTKVTFRTDIPGDDTKQTFFSDATGNAVMPGDTLDTVDIYIDGTGPTGVTLSADKSCTKDNVQLTFSADDATSGVDHFELFVDSVSKGAVASPYTLNLGEYAEGAHAIKVRAHDKCGNSTDSDEVTVSKDTTAPSITCPADVTVNTDAGSCAATGVSLGTATASDTCSAVTVTNDAPSSFAKGATTVTWTATDAAGNFASCTQTVTVSDTENPTIAAPADVTASTDAGLCYATGVALGSPAYSDNCPGSTVSNDAPAEFPKGDTTVTWTVTDASGNTDTATQTVTVNDTEAPTIACPVDVTVNTDAGLCYATGVALGTPSAGDNCAVASVTSDAPAQFPKGDTTVTWTVTDTSGNTATCEQKVTVTDTEAPVVSLNGQAVIHLQCPTDTYTEPDATATDNCDPVSVTITGAVDEGNEGVYTITYTATDTAGNTGTQTRTVYVEGAALSVNVPGPLTLECEGGGGFANTDSRIAEFLSAATASDGCENDATITNDAPEFFPVGATVVTWTATDPDGGTATGTQTVTVTDGTSPVITGCPTAIMQSADTGVCDAVVTWTAPTASDICGDVTLTSDHDAGDTFPVGTTSVTYTATDEQSNTATCSFMVTVTDNQAPSIAGCPSNIAVSTSAGACTAVVTWTAPTASDNCSVASFTSNKASGDAFDKGTTTVTYTALDASGNSATCSFTVTVTDTEKPTITCPANKVVSTDADQCGATGVDLGTPVTADNCGVASVTNNAPSLFPTGDTIVTWTVTDTSGNTETCTQTVTVNDAVPPTITCPVSVTVNADPGSCQVSGVTLDTPTTADNCAVAGVANDAPASFSVGETTVIWTVTDTSGNTATCTQTVTVVDNQVPVITIESARQNAQELIGTGSAAVQGTVQIAVTAADNCTQSPLAPPSVTVTPNGGSATAATFVNESPTGKFNYTWTVTASTPNGTATIDASVEDASHNISTAEAKTFTVNKNRASGTVSFSTWSTAAYSFTRDVVFVATNDAVPNAILKTWTVSVAFTNSAQVASGSYTLTDVPGGTTHVSAKTAWDLRKRVDVDLGETGQIAPSFKLLGGDLNNSNSVNILDYSKMVTSWGGSAAGDINGDGFTGTLDYSIMKANWFKAGDQP